MSHTKNNLTHGLRAYKTMYRQGLTVDQALQNLAQSAAEFPEVALFCDSVRQSSRGITR